MYSDNHLGRPVPAAKPAEARRAPQPVAVRLHAFGRFRTEVDGAASPLPPLATTVLARLVLARGGLVHADTLYRDCWPDPVRIMRREHRVAVHKRIHMIRMCLAAGGRAPQEVLFTERAATTGYRLILDPNQVDIHRFEDLVWRAGAGWDNVAVDLLIQALGLWRERPLLGLHDQDFVRAGAQHLAALRERACRDLVSVSPALGRTRDALHALDRLQAAQPEDTALQQQVAAWRAELHVRANR
ncbi:bacterial transcriptional activator domain-containing protein [Catellatospora sp. KI3]|uniref:AfsR/SARP family transcriptional regulator n=1 Tax=Catellatospora sp. KI3 TaxID=3041620 RepID=UPI002482BCEB|nr:bacterial transcriptional activator domain-containing protein [Catellatospora sp. KI3]MDI1464104.1 bacterial transcriptional activator domain-containing protein [Catellatospora sp. KI3]